MATANRTETDIQQSQPDTQKTPEQEAQEMEQAALAHNLRFYNKGMVVPEDALKAIISGRLKGKSDVNPMWRMKRLTEIFGPVGFGWRYEIVKQWTEVYGEEVKCFCNINLYIRDPETKEWSAPIPGNGGSSLVSKEKAGPYVNDEGYKMALTDALSIAMKPIGIGANVWYGPKATGHNESKYESGACTETRDQPTQQQSQYSQPKTLTGDLLNKAIAEMNAVRNFDELNNVWNKWQCEFPEGCIYGSPFWNATAQKNAQLNQAR